MTSKIRMMHSRNSAKTGALGIMFLSVVIMLGSFMPKVEAEQAQHDKRRQTQPDDQVQSQLELQHTVPLPSSAS